MCAEFLIENNKSSIVSDCGAIEQSICVMVFSKVITNDNLGVKKYCVNERKVLGKILYILSQILRILGIKKITGTLRFFIHGACRGVDCFLLYKINFMTWPIS